MKLDIAGLQNPDPNSLEYASMPVFRSGRVVRFPKEPVLAWLRRREPRLCRRIAHNQRKPVANGE